MSTVLPPRTTAPSNGMGTAGFVLGLLAALFSLIPIIGVIAWPLSVLGLIFGTIGIIRAHNGIAANKALAIAGTALAAIGFVLCFAWVAAIGSSANQAAEQRLRSQQNTEAPMIPADSITDADDAAQRVIELEFGGTHIWPGGETAVVSPPREHHESNPFLLPEGARAVEVDLIITNGTDDEINSMSWDITATHDGRPAQPMLTDDAFADAQIPPGAKLTLTRSFQVSPDTGELRISVQPSLFAQHTAYYIGEF